MVDQNVTSLYIANVTNTNKGTITSSSPVFQGFNLNNQSRISDELNVRDKGG